MKRPQFGVAATLPATILLAGMLPRGAFAQPIAIDENGLDNVTASSATAWQPATGTPLIVVGSNAERENATTVSLESSVQSDARVLNLANAAGSDVAQAVNVSDSRSRAFAGNRAADIEQRNELSQTDETLAFLGGFESPGGVVERHSEISGRTDEAFRHLVRIEEIDRRLASQTVTTRFQATVEPEFVGIFDTPVSLGGYDISLPKFELSFLPFDVSFTHDDDSLLSYFLKSVETTIDIAPIDVTGATLHLGEVTLDGKDIIFSAPTLTTPSLSFSFCFFSDCSTADDAEHKYTTLSIGAQTIPLSPVGAVRLDDVNPLGDLGMSFGYAIAGDGTISFEAGGIEFAGSIPIDLGAFSDLEFDLTIPNIDTFDGFTADFEMPTLSIPVDLRIDFPQPTLSNQRIDGEACTFNNGQQQCAPLDQTVETHEEAIRSSNGTDVTETETSESHATVSYERSRGDLSVEEGQADAIVLRDSSLADKRYRLVVIGGNAQRGIRASNAVNAATAIIGNGLNLSSDRTGGRQVTGGLESTQNQTNTFRQIGGL